jgi:hypothetical protein
MNMQNIIKSKLRQKLLLIIDHPHEHSGQCMNIASLQATRLITKCFFFEADLDLAPSY